jgi:hypothetical protein
VQRRLTFSTISIEYLNGEKYFSCATAKNIIQDKRMTKINSEPVKKEWSLLPSAGARLFCVSFLILFFELVCIRWVPAYIRYLSYFSNFVLL